MERLNSEGILRDQLTFALRSRRLVMDARKIDACLLCRRPKVNDAGLCDVCYSSIDGEELDLAVAWLRGTQP